MEFFIRPVQVFMQFQKHQGVYGFKKFDILVVATTILHRFDEFCPNLTVNSEILGEVQASELFSVKSVYRHIHHSLLGFVHGERFTFKEFCFVEFMQEPVQERVHQCQFLLVGFLNR